MGIRKQRAILRPQMTRPLDVRTRSILAGAGILLALTVLICGLLLGWRYVPGVLGEWLGFVIGVITTPFFMEAGFALLGLSLVVLLNHWRQKRSGDELVYLEQVEPSAGLPEHAQWAVFKERPLEVDPPTRLEQLEGAIAIGDHQAAAEILAEMTGEELQSPAALALRLELAKATGRQDLAAMLEERLRAPVAVQRP